MKTSNVESPKSKIDDRAGEYHFKLLHKPGKTHVKPDILLRRQDLDRAVKDNENEILLKKEHFHQMEFIL